MSAFTSTTPNQIIAPSPSTPYHTHEDNFPLLSITPATIFLHDGIISSFQLNSLKEFEQQSKYHDALTISSTDQMEEFMAIGNSSSSPTSVTGELSRKIIRLSTHHVQSVALHHRFQWHILEKVWRYQRALALEKLEKENSVQNALSVLEMDKEGSMQHDPMANSARLGFKLSLCLLVPMLEMYSHQNQAVALSALQLIFSELSNVPVMSLSQESSNSIEKLEDLLHLWASNPDAEFHVPGPSAMVALACARGTISSFLKTILMLENLENPLRLLPVAGILRKLNDSRTLGIGKPCGIHSDKHILTWHYDDRLMTDSMQLGVELGTKTHPQFMPPQPVIEEAEASQVTLTNTNRAGPSIPPPPPLPPQNNRAAASNNSGGGAEDVQKHSLATDGAFLYVTGPDGKGLSKMGSGLNGTLRGWVYHNNLELNCGFLAYADRCLISRPYELDKMPSQEKIPLGVSINKETLKPDKLIFIEGLDSKVAEFHKKNNLLTLGLTSDGSLLYLVRAEFHLAQPRETSVGSEASFLTAPSSAPSSSTPQTPLIHVWLEIFTLQRVPSLSYIKATPTLSSPLLLTRQEESPSPSSSGNSERYSLNSNLTNPIGPLPEDRAGTGPGFGPLSVRRTRSVRITAGGAPPPPPPLPLPPGSLSFPSSCENINTSLNVTLKQLQSALYLTCGNYLSIVVSTNVHLIYVTATNSPQPPPHGPTNPVIPTYRQYCPVLSSTCTKSIGFQLHVNLMKASEGSSVVVKEDLSNLPLDSSFFHGAVIPEMGAAYDSRNNMVWTTNGQFMDSWKNPGHVPPWKQDQILLLGNTLNSEISAEGRNGQMADVRTVINVMLRHVGIMANHFLLGDKQDANIGFILDHKGGSGSGLASVIRTLISLILKYREGYQGAEMTAIFLIMKAIVSQFKLEQLAQGTELKNSLHDVQLVVLALLNGYQSSKTVKKTSQVAEQASSLFAMAFDLLYTSPKSRNDFFQELYNFIEAEDIDTILLSDEGNSGNLKMLEGAILQYFTESLNNPAIDWESGLKWIVASPWLARIVRSSSLETHLSLLRLSKKSTDELVRMASTEPMTSVRTQYVNAVVNFLLRGLTVLPHSGKDVVDMSVDLIREVLKAGPTIAENCLEFIGGVDGGLNLAVYNCTEGILKGSMLGNGIPQILSYLSLDSLPSGRRLLDELTEECVQLTVAMSFLAERMNPSPYEAGTDWSSHAQIHSPWHTKKVFESTHPVRENQKSSYTIVIPEARQLYAKFSPQCATQYDYDRLIFSRDAKKLFEFGGNYFGYGNRFFSGPGWARTCVRLTEGNAVTFNFEVKSGREHTVPDKALYGYHFTVLPVMDYSDKQKPGRGQDDLESLAPVTTGFATISALHCIDVIHNVSRVLLEGSEPTTEEKWNSSLLESKFLAGLKWSSRLSIGTDPVPRKFSPELLAKLKRTVGVPPLQMRLSIIEKMRAPELEELYVQCCLQHVGTNPYLNQETLLSPVCESCWSLEPTRDILREIFNLINTLFRNIMGFYEMEKMLSQEIEEISNKTKDINEAFFMDLNFRDNPTDLQTLAWICYLDYDKENPMHLIKDVLGMVEALSADGKPPTLTRTDELIEETHLKCKYILAATPCQNIFGQVYPTQKVLLERLHNIHNFVSSHMSNPHATVTSFFEALRSRRERAGDRIKGLDVLHKVLECSSPCTSLLIVSSILLQNGPRLQSILCSGLEPEVLRIFGEVMKIVVGIAEKNPLLHRYSIALLSVTPYDRTDEENLVESGLVGLLDQLCAFQTGHLTPRGSPTDTTRAILPAAGAPAFSEAAQIHNKASTLAWAAFQVLAGQCASWERSTKHQQSTHAKHGTNPGREIEDHSFSEWDEPEHRELPLQISINITNHLARAANLAAMSSSGVILPTSQLDDRTITCSPSLSVAIQDVLDLLNNLRQYKIGRAILKQSPCICRLIGLLQDPRLSPRLVLTILQLLHTALPLVDDLDTTHFKQIVPKGRMMPPLGGSRGISHQQQLHAATIATFWTVIESSPYTQVGSMLLSKLADYLVCGSNKPSASDPPKVACSQDDDPSAMATSQGLIDSKFERMEVWLHKLNENQNQASSLIRQLFVEMARQELRPTRGTIQDLENELNTNGKVLLYLDESPVAERKALRLSQLGHFVTLLPAGWSRTPYHIPLTMSGGSRGGGNSNNMIICKEKNNHLASWDPARPFLSGHVAENLASEIVQLVRALLTSSTFSSASHGAINALSSCGSQGNLQSGSSTASVSSMVGAASICTGNMGDSDSLTSEMLAPSTTPQKGNSVWHDAVEQVICGAMKLLPRLLSIPNPTTAHIESYVYSARLIISALTVLGGFTETIRAGLEVWIVEEESERQSLSQVYASSEEGDPTDRWEYSATRAKVISVSDNCPTAKVEIIQGPVNSTTGKDKNPSKPLAVADIITLPLSRLVPGHYTKCGSPNLPVLSRLAQMELAGFLKTLLVHPGTTSTVPGNSKGAAAAGANTSTGNQVEYPLKKTLPTLNQIVSGVGTANGQANSNSQPISDSRQIAQSMTIIRLLAEIRTKSMQVLALWLRRKEFSEIFVGIGSESHFSTKKYSADVHEATESLKELSKQCIPSHKPSSLENQVAWMRLLYRDCTKPPRLPITSDKLMPGAGGQMNEGMRWDLARQFPKIKSTVFSSISNSLVYTGDYNVSGGNPRGLLLFGNRVISMDGFYWEATIVTMEDPGQHADLIIVPPLSIGFSPVPASATTPSSNDVWKYSNGTVMYTTLGRVVHYKTQDPGSWITVRLDDDNSFRVRAGDTIGVGWEKPPSSSSDQAHPSTSPRVQVLRQAARNTSMSLVESMVTPNSRGNSRRARHLARSFNQILDSPGVPGNNSGFGIRGQVYFTLNGRRLPSTVEQSNCSLHPILHVQKRQMIVNTNLGERPFLYAEANRRVRQPQSQPTSGGGSGAQSSALAYQQRNNVARQVITAEANTGPSNADVLLRRVSDSLQDLNISFDAEWDEPDHSIPAGRNGSGSTISGASNRSTGRSAERRMEDEEIGMGIEDEEWDPLDLDEDADDDDDDNDEDSDDADNQPEALVGSDTLLSARNRTGSATGGGTFRLLPPSPASGVSTSSIITTRTPRQQHRSGGSQQRPSNAKKQSTGENGAKSANSLSNLEFGGSTKKTNELVAKPHQKTSEYNPVKSLEYFMNHSPTSGIKVFQGPRRYVCPCAAHCRTPLDCLLLENKQDGLDRREVDSIDSYESDEEDDIHSLLVKAWETKVFPTIRRRFRNESERRDGLEQIRGALQLGMLDIARQTVEFLYEEGGGLPRDLHFPTLEEMRSEAVRCTMDKLKPGMNVIIRPIQQEDLGLLPPFAVSAMLRTFGLVGEVLEVDQSNDLVLLESYIESEGILVRFWYPVSYLDKTQSHKKPTLSATTVNMFKLHSHLISMEVSLSNLYSRQCYLALSQHEKSPVGKFDLDSIQILSDNSLANYPPSRDLFTYNLQCESPSLSFLQDCGNPSVLFYRRDHEFNLISSKLQQQIRKASSGSPEDELTVNKLTASLLSCLESPAKFPKLDVPLDRIHDVEVVTPGMAFSLISFKSSATGQMTNKQMASIDNTVHPCLHLFSYDSGELSRHLMACYPLEPLQVVMHRASSGAAGNEDGTSPQIISHTAPTTAGASGSSAAAAVNKNMRKRHGRFPPVMVPTDRIHCSISELNLNDVTCEIQGIPKEFPLAILYLQELIAEFHRSNTDQSPSSSLSLEHVTEAVTRLLNFVDQFPICPVIKEWIFNLTAELARVKSPQTDMEWKVSPNDRVAKSCTPNRLFLELLLLHDKETAEQSLPLHFIPILNALNENIYEGSSAGSSAAGNKGKFAPSSLMFHISSFISGHQRPVRHLVPPGVVSGQPNFSFYFNSLNDLCLALNEASEVMVNPFEIIPCPPPPAPPTALSEDSSPIGTPPGGASTTDSGHAFTQSSGAGASSQSKKTPPRHTLTAKRMTKTFTSQRDVRTPAVKKFGYTPNVGGGTAAPGSSSAEKGPKPALSSTSAAEDGMIAFSKASEIEWFNNQVIISRALKDIVWHSPSDVQNIEATQVLIGAVLEKLKVSQIHTHFLVIQGAPVNIDGMSIEASLIRALRGCGGIHGNEMWISGNSAVVEIRSLAKVNEAYDTLKQNKVWYPLEDYVLYPNVTVSKLNEQLHVYNPATSSSTSPSPPTVLPTTSNSQSGEDGDHVLRKFLKNKLSDSESSDKLSPKAREVLTNIFMSCYAISIPFIMEENAEEETLFQNSEEMEVTPGRNRVVTLSEEQIRLKLPGNLFDLFVTGLKGPSEVEPILKDVLQKFGEKSNMSQFPPIVNLDEPNEADSKGKKDDKDCKTECQMAKEEKASSHDESPQQLEQLVSQSQTTGLGLSLQGYLNWCTKLMKTEVNFLWRGLFAAGYDIRLDRVWVSQDVQCISQYFHTPEKWSLEKDAALISYMDQFGQSLHLDPTRIQPVEVYLTESDFLNPAFTALQGTDIAYLRIRWGMFQKINNLVGKKLLPHVSLHNVSSSKRSTARLLHDSRQLLLYFIKDAYLYKIIQVSAARGGDTPTPEITLDPVSSIGSQDENVFKNQLSQIIQQMSTITTAFYCVPPAQGADPALPISVKFTGEEVLGLSGSFRQFLLNAAKELQSETVRLLSRCPSADAGRNRDCFIITPGKLSYGEEDFLYFLGQLIGISIRADAPLALPLLRATWRSLLQTGKECNDSSDDLIEADVLCATYLNKLESFPTKQAFDNFLSLNAWPKFHYPSMDNKTIVPLCPDGSSISVGFSNRAEFIKLIKFLREKELHSKNRVAKILTGLATILPLPALLGLFTSNHLELRIAGSPEVNLSLLKSHTHYQVGVNENDPHIMYFWATLESFTPEELKKFVKFAANLERLPVTCPCQSDNHAALQEFSPNANNNAVHVPPFPMKIAPMNLPPSATTEDIDKRLIRVETCLFLLRLPPYSSLQVTRQQLLFAINCREDPLSG